MADVIEHALELMVTAALVTLSVWVTWQGLSFLLKELYG